MSENFLVEDNDSLVVLLHFATELLMFSVYVLLKNWSLFIVEGCCAILLLLADDKLAP
jgi:hypothetical protein